MIIVKGHKKMDLPVTEEQLKAHANGALAQDAFPDLSPNHREFIISGVTPVEWYKTFGGEPPMASEWFDSCLWPKDAALAVKYMTRDRRFESLEEALIGSFDWHVTPEGEDYWTARVHGLKLETIDNAYYYAYNPQKLANSLSTFNEGGLYTDES